MNQAKLIRRDEGIPHHLKYELLAKHREIFRGSSRLVPGLSAEEQRKREIELWDEYLREKNIPGGPYSWREESDYFNYSTKRYGDDQHRSSCYNAERAKLRQIYLNSTDREYLEGELKKIFLKGAYEGLNESFDERNRKRELLWQQRLREKNIALRK